MKLGYYGNPSKLSEAEIMEIIRNENINGITKGALWIELARREEIEKLAYKSLQDKWYEIKESVIREESQQYNVWTDDCAFCLHAKVNRKKYRSICESCVIGDSTKVGSLICNVVENAYQINDYVVIIDALEELRDNGKLSKEMKHYLKHYDEIDENELQN